MHYDRVLASKNEAAGIKSTTGFSDERLMAPILSPLTLRQRRLRPRLANLLHLGRLIQSPDKESRTESSNMLSNNFERPRPTASKSFDVGEKSRTESSNMLSNNVERSTPTASKPFDVGVSAQYSGYINCGLGSTASEGS